jgi:aspartyl-tRNA(Asn)/glutamyl-tRNA(Gln) amidotransferase subunit C
MDERWIFKAAHLAKISISEQEAEVFSSQMGRALEYFKEIQSIDTSGVEPLFSPFEEQMNLREDLVAPSIEAEEILSQAPDRVGQLFRVPPAVEEK